MALFNNEKKPMAIIRLTLLANRAAPSPILGQALGQYGINIMEFCKNFNNQTKNNANVYVPTQIKIFNHNSFEILVKTPSNTYLLKKTANISKGVQKQSNGDFIYTKEIYHLAVIKVCDRLMNHLSIKALCKTLIGSAKSMGLSIRNKVDKDLFSEKIERSF